MSVVIKVVGFANGANCPIAGEYVESFNFDAYGGKGHGVFTREKDKAKQFAKASEALQFWKTQSTVRPVRPDGKPNRPLTASTVIIERLKEELPGEPTKDIKEGR